MGYEEFRQMVLGANLFSMKPGRVENVMKDSAGPIVNHTAYYQKIVDENYESAGAHEDAVKRTLQLREDETLKPPKNSVEFDQWVTKKLKDPL